jgi:hypothetical protein
MEGRAVVLPYQQMVFESFISGSAEHVLTEVNIPSPFIFFANIIFEKVFLNF